VVGVVLLILPKTTQETGSACWNSRRFLEISREFFLTKYTTDTSTPYLPRESCAKTGCHFWVMGSYFIFLAASVVKRWLTPVVNPCGLSVVGSSNVQPPVVEPTLKLNILIYA
jgi:hypothetical protein